MVVYRLLTDLELLPLSKEGNQEAFSELYSRYWHALYIYACKMLGSDDAEDVIQEVFTSIWLNGNELRIKSSVASYLYSAVRYKIFDHFDRRKVRANYVDSLQHFADKGEYISDNYIREKELARLIEAEIRLLPEKMRQVFEMSRKEYLSQKEIAERLSISNTTVKKQISNAVKILRVKIAAMMYLFTF